jgi:hypothetical protein
MSLVRVVKAVSLLTLVAGIGCGSVSVGGEDGGAAGKPADGSAPVDTSVNTDATVNADATNTADTVVVEDAGQDATVARHTLTVAASGNGMGTITSEAGIDCGTDCTTIVDEGTKVTLLATASGGSTFAGWAGADCTGTGTCVVTVTADVTVQAAFALQNSVVAMLAGTGKGTITSAPEGINCPGDCSQAYGPGQSVTLTAAPAAGSTFTGWSGGGCTGTSTCVVSTNSAVAVTATFTLITFPLTVAKAGTGAGTVSSNMGGIACGAACAASFVPGTMVTLTAAPAAGSTFGGWSGGGCTGTAACVVSVAAATTVTATFTLNTYAFSVVKAGTGTGTVVSPSGINCGATCTQMVNHGTIIGLTATPAAGSTFAGWTGGGCAGTGPCTVTATAATSVTATFTLQQFTLSVAKNGTGSGTVTGTGISCGATCSATYPYGTNVTLTATPTAGSTFAGWSGVCAGTGTCTVSMVVARSVTATFNVATLTCTNQVNATSCTNAVISEINMGPISAAACRAGCITALNNAGVATGCWIVPSNGNCYCRGGVLSISNMGGYPGGSCSR